MLSQNSGKSNRVFASGRSQLRRAGSVEGAAERPEKAKAVLAELQNVAKRRFVTAYGVALVYAGIGDSEAALTWLDPAFAERSHWLVWLRLDPRFGRLRTDPRFSELLDRIRFPQAEG